MTVSEPRYFTALPEDPAKLRCTLCPRRCVIPLGKAGSCGVRQNREGRGDLPFYGFVTVLAEDPIEKKPLYHFRPGSTILSAGFAGCNLHCPFCQNYHISQTTDVPGRLCSPEELIAIAGKDGFTQIAYTYSEPLIHAEYLIDCMSLARKAGISSVLVSNGCGAEEVAGEVLALVDAANIDLKCFSRETYSHVLGGDLDTVCDFIRRAYAAIPLVEITTLIVPGLNDRPEELDAAAAFLGKISVDIPWHLAAYHPAYRWKSPATAGEFIRDTARRARQSLRYVYTGNISGESNDTACPHCGAVLVSRRNCHVETGGLILKTIENRRAYYCRNCGEAVPLIRYGGTGLPAIPVMP